MPAPAPRTPTAFGLTLALTLGWAAAAACKAGPGDRCICADDCKPGLVCLADGRVLDEDINQCSPAVGEGANPGECIDADAAGLGDEGFPEPETFMDLGAKRDFSPGSPPAATDTGTGTDTDTGGTEAGTTDGEPTGTTATSAATTTDTGTTDTDATTIDTGATETDTGTGDTTATDTTAATGSTGG
jgi:hypothetical protein